MESPPSLATTGYPISSAAATALSAVLTFLSGANGTPYADSSSFESDSERVREDVDTALYGTHFEHTTPTAMTYGE